MLLKTPASQPALIASGKRKRPELSPQCCGRIPGGPLERRLLPRPIAGRARGSHDVPQLANCVLYALGPGIAAIDANEVFKLLLCGEERAGRNRDSCRQRLMIECKSFDVRRQFHPKAHSARGPRELGAFRKVT